MSDIPAVDPEVFRRSRLEAERAAEVRAEELRRRGTWLVALRVALSVGLLVVSFFPIIGEKRTSKQHVVWEYVGAIGQGLEGTLVGIWTLATLLLVVAALVTPGGRVGRRRQWATLGFLITFAGGHFVLAAMGNGGSGTSVFAGYWVLVGLAAATATAWFPRQDIDAPE
jgi:hypothetical protein